MICPHCKKETVPHGSSRYTYGCRCEICKKARSEQFKSYRKKLKEKKK